MSVSCIKVENVEKHVLILVVAAAVARSMVNGECEPRTQCIANAIAFNFILICDPIGGMSVFACDRQRFICFICFIFICLAMSVVALVTGFYRLLRISIRYIRSDN